MSSPSPQPPVSFTLSSEELFGLEKLHPGVSSTMRLFSQRTAIAETATHPEDTAGTLNYLELAAEHAELIKQGKTSIEIAMWLGDKLNIVSWKEGTFHGERKALSAPTSEEMIRLQQFVRVLQTSRTETNGYHDNQPHIFLIYPSVQNAFFGLANMKKSDDVISQMEKEWKTISNDYIAQEQYLKEKIGLVQCDLESLRIIRYRNNGFGEIVPFQCRVSDSATFQEVLDSIFGRKELDSYFKAYLFFVA